MALDKWQLREVEKYARDNEVTEDEAREALHPSAPPAAPKGAKVDVAKARQ